MQDIQIPKNFQDWLTIATHSQVGKSAKGLSMLVEGLELTVISCASAYQTKKVCTESQEIMSKER